MSSLSTRSSRRCCAWRSNPYRPRARRRRRDDAPDASRAARAAPGVRRRPSRFQIVELASGWSMTVVRPTSPSGWSSSPPRRVASAELGRSRDAGHHRYRQPHFARADYCPARGQRGRRLRLLEQRGYIEEQGRAAGRQPISLRDHRVVSRPDGPRGAARLPRSRSSCARRDGQRDRRRDVLGGDMVERHLVGRGRAPPETLLAPVSARRRSCEVLITRVE